MRDPWPSRAEEPRMDMPKTPIGGSFAWTVPQVMQRDDFPLDRLTTRLGALRAQIRSGLGFGYIKGLPVERYDRETLIRIYWGLSRHIGDPVTQNRNGHVVGHVIDVGDTEQHHNRRLTQSTA